MPAFPPPPAVILIGCGAVSQQFYLPALRTLQNAGQLIVHGLVDPSGAARAPLQQAFPRARATDTLDEIWAPPGTLAIVASPPQFHAPQTIAACEHGWHVLCEKPMASSSAEAERMIAAATHHQRLLAVGLYKRFFPSSRYLRALCQDELLGALMHYTIVEGGPFRWPAASRSFFDRTQTPGGVLLDIGVHVLDLLDWCLGAPAQVKYADDAMGGLETNAVLELSYVNGARGNLHLSRDWSTGNLYTFVFERGVVRWRVNDANGLTVQLASAPAAVQGTLIAPSMRPLPTLPPRPLATNAESFVAQLRNVIGAVAGREKLLVSGEQGLRSLRLIEQCYAQRTLLPQPWLTPPESAQAQALADSPLVVS